MAKLRRTRFLTVMVVVTVIANLGGIVKLTALGDDLLAAHPKLTPNVLYALLVCPVVAIGAALALGAGRAAGYWVLLVDCAVVIGADLVFDMPLVHAATVAVLCGLLTWAFVGARDRSAVGTDASRR